MACRADTDDQQAFIILIRRGLLPISTPSVVGIMTIVTLAIKNPGPDQQQWVTVCGAARTEQHGNGRKKQMSTQR